MPLTKSLTVLDVFCIATGAMLSGLFVLPGTAFAQVGPAVLLSYAVAAALALTGLFSQAELVSAMPKAGGAYFYVTRSMGSGVGTVYGLITWFSLALKSAYELFFMAALICLLVNWNPALNPFLAAGLCLIFIAINLVGVKEAGKLQVVLVFALFSVLAYFGVIAVNHLEPQNFKPFFTTSPEKIFTTAGYVFISFGGLLKVASVAEEVRNPGKVVPQSMLISLFIIANIYLVVIFLLIASTPAATLSGSAAPLVDAATIYKGQLGYYIFSAATILAIITSANAGVMTASRYPLALARDSMLPDWVAQINTRFSTPHYSVLLTGAVVVAACFVKIDTLVKAASSVLILTYLFSCLAVIILRESRIQNYQPQFKSILYPWLQLLGMVGFLALLYEIGLEAVLTTAVLMVMGFLAYWFFGRKQVRREFALLHLIERITARELTTHSLETELKDIVHERDEVLKDRFDHLIEQCTVIDVDEAVELSDFFTRAATAMTGSLALEADHLKELFLQREKESSTVLSPFLAIPHIVVEGQHHFDVLIARSREGFHFSDDAPRVHTVFMLVGTRDERPFHLTSLAAIAQIVQDPDFEKRWMSAKSPDALRDIVLLGKRQRQK